MNESSGSPAYRVLARKYRPANFAELIGQEAMVRTLTNAIRSGRLAHAFILTGVRGVGKTTTARIIARALNCVGPNGDGGPTPEPCGVCEHCVAIAEDRHVDVLEMDAASRTGVDDIREVIDGVLYRPTSARYKIYIIDEVHMLSKNAFNALLKTLEEPPEHVKFIFATTEIRRVPVTVLSRCQRFDLRRVEAQVLTDHFRAIAAKEEVSISDGALALVARAADGSVRDGLSLLDQAIAHSDGGITEEQVRDMLGLADRMGVYDLMDSLMKGDVAASLDLLQDMYDSGADPVAVIQDLLELTHALTRIKIVPDSAADAAASDVERGRAGDMAAALSMPVLARAWQLLLKGLDEVRRAPNAIQAAEMVLVRLAYVSDLPAPADLVRALSAGKDGAATQPENTGRAQPAPAADVPRSEGPLAVSPQPSPEPAPAADPVDPRPAPTSFKDVVALFDLHKEGMLYAHLMNDVHLVRFEQGRIEIRPGQNAPRDLANRLGHKLEEWTGVRWVISVSGEQGDSTLRQQIDQNAADRRDEALGHPLVRKVLDTFPGATVREVRDRGLGSDEFGLPDPDDGVDDGDESL